MNLKGNDFLKLLDYTPEQIDYLLRLAAQLKAEKKAGIPHRLCEGKNVALISRPEDVPEDIIKLAVYCPDGTSECRHTLAPKWSGELSVASAGPDWVDFNLADKASGLAALCRALGVPASETAAFGDNWNDAPMLKLAGRGYIMSGPDEAMREQFELQCENVETVLEHILQTGDI